MARTIPASSPSRSADAPCARTRCRAMAVLCRPAVRSAVRARCLRYPTLYTLRSSTTLKMCVDTFSFFPSLLGVVVLMMDCGHRCTKVSPRRKCYRNDGERMRSMRCAAPYESLLSNWLLTRRATAGPLYEVQRLARDCTTGEWDFPISLSDARFLTRIAVVCTGMRP